VAGDGVGGRAVPNARDLPVRQPSGRDPSDDSGARSGWPVLPGRRAIHGATGAGELEKGSTRPGDAAHQLGAPGSVRCGPARDVAGRTRSTLGRWAAPDPTTAPDRG